MRKPATEEPSSPGKGLLGVKGSGPANARMFQHCLSKQTPARATADLLSAKTASQTHGKMPASPASARPELATTGVSRLRLPWGGE